MTTPHRENDELWELAKVIVDDCRTPILTTADGDGVPHATWMGAVAGPGLTEILSITSPDSLKVDNIASNGVAEWMFTSSNKDQIVYLSGPTRIVKDVAEIKRFWKVIPEKQHAFFLNYYNSGVGFAIIRTAVDKAILCEPKEYRKTELVRG